MENKSAKEQAVSPVIDDKTLAMLKETLRAELLAELSAQGALERENKSGAAADKPVKDPWLEEYVSVQLFKGGKDFQEDVFVSVNGENCRIQRGMPVRIKRKFALVLEQSDRQREETERYMEGIADRA